jgi:hypothetical protein
VGHFEERIDGVVTHEGETVSCSHCQAIIRVRDNRGLFVAPEMCAYEHKPLCTRCARIARQRVNPQCGGSFEDRLERAAARARFLRSAGIIT